MRKTIIIIIKCFLKLYFLYYKPRGLLYNETIVRSTIYFVISSLIESSTFQQASIRCYVFRYSPNSGHWHNLTAVFSFPLSYTPVVRHVSKADWITKETLHLLVWDCSTQFKFNYHHSQNVIKCTENYHRKTVIKRKIFSFYNFFSCRLIEVLRYLAISGYKTSDLLSKSWRA